MDSNDVRRQWAERSGEYSPEYYAYYGPNETSDVILRTLERFVDRTAPVLELGCSSGRHLSHLYENGFDSPVGIELNADAFDVMADHYPDLAADGEFYHAAIEDVVREFDDDQFGAVYSVETLQHLHPDAEWVFEELVRITDDLLITVENEGELERDATDQSDTERSDLERNATGHAEPTEPEDVSYVNDDFPLYYRDWSAIFTELGFDEVDVQTGKRDTIRTFRPAAASDR
ncbi:class I SAM-dependent methyltransferase [Haloterrigena salinisoli]|uniref:class I SAM-dependent methyltransferase n=1 Tax=Haloterrigena salinisoli TaxID=3132747 RepID=UPI0030CB96A1